MVIVRTEDRGYVHVYTGGLLPDDAVEGEAERLAADGLVTEVDEVSEGDEHPKRRGRS